MIVLRLAVQFFDASSAMPFLARASSAAPPADFSAGHQHAQGFLDVGLQRDLGAVILGEIPVDETDLHHRKTVRHRIDFAVDRHPQGIGAEHDHEVVGRERLAHLLLQARQRAHEARAFREEMRAIGRRALECGRAQRFGQFSGFLQRIAFDDLVAGDDHRPLGFQDARGQRLQRFVRRTHAGIDPGGAAELDAGLGIEDVAGQRDEHRAHRRRGRDLGGAAHDARQILQPRHLDRPFHQRLGHLHQRAIQHRLHQPVALLLLAGGEDHRRARELCIEQRAHRIAKARRDMDVAGNQFSRGAGKTVGDRDHQALLHRHHIGEIGMVLQRMHDRQFGGAGIAEQMRDALVLQQRKKGRAPGNAIFHSSPPAHGRVGLRGGASWTDDVEACNGARRWLQCALTRVPDAMQRVISAFTRVFDALWLRRAGTHTCASENGPRLCSAPRSRAALRPGHESIQWTALMAALRR